MIPMEGPKKRFVEKNLDLMNHLLNCSICAQPIEPTSMAQYPNVVCQTCNSKAVNEQGNRPSHSSINDFGDNPVYINGQKCWRRYRFGGHIAMLDTMNCSTLEEFYMLQKLVSKGPSE